MLSIQTAEQTKAGGGQGWWGEVVRPMVVASANCGQDPQWHYTQCGSAILVMFTAWVYIANIPYMTSCNIVTTVGLIFCLPFRSNFCMYICCLFPRNTWIKKQWHLWSSVKAPPINTNTRIEHSPQDNDRKELKAINESSLINATVENLIFCHPSHFIYVVSG